MAMAAITAGADSLMIEVHPNPAKALSDGPQSLTLEQYEELMHQMAVIGQAVGRWSQKFPVSTAPSGSQRHQAASGSPSVELSCTSQSYQSNHLNDFPKAV